LGTRVLFHIPVEIGLRFDEHNSVSLFWEHTSNAGLGHLGFGEDYNDGMDRVGIRYGYQF
jgi:lipid A 3-O-deacylase